MTFHPIVTWSGKVHYRDDDEIPQWDAWDRRKKHPSYAAICNPNTIGYPPVRSAQGNLVATHGVKQGDLLGELTTCRLCAKKVAS